MENRRGLRPWIQSGAMLAVHAVGALLVFVALAVVVPNVTRVYRDFEASLPALTQAAILLSDFTVHRWYVSMPLAALLGLADGLLLVLLSLRERTLLFWIWAIGVFAVSGLLAVATFLVLYLPVLPCC